MIPQFRSPSRFGWLRPAALPFLAGLFVAGLTRVAFPFDGLHVQDAFSYFRFARALWPHLSTGVPLPEFQSPRGFPVAIALLLPFTGGGPFAGQLVNWLSCAWTAAATALIVQALEPARADTRPCFVSPPMAAGLCVACSGAVLRYSQLVMADGLTMGLVATAVLSAVMYRKGGQGPWLVAGAAALAWAAASRWLAGLLALPLLLYVIAGIRERRAGRPTGHPVQWLWLAAAGLAGSVIMLPQLIVARAVPGALGNHPWVVGWSLTNLAHSDVHTPAGHSHYRLPVGLFYLARLGWPDYFFPTLAVFVALGAWKLFREERLSELALLLGWPALVWLFISGIPFENPRYLLPTLPTIGVLLGIGVAAINRSKLRGLRWIAPATLVISVVAGIGWGGREHGRQVARKNEDVSLINWTNGRVPADADLLMAGPTLAFEHYGHRHPYPLFSLTEQELDAMLSEHRQIFVLADPADLASQWKGMAPERHLSRLRENPGLSTVGVHPPYTLFVVREPRR